MGPIIKAFGLTFLIGDIFNLFEVLLAFVAPQLLRQIVKFVESGGNVTATDKFHYAAAADFGDGNVVHTPMWHGIFYALLLFIVASLRTLLHTQYLQCMIFVGLRMRTALVGTIYLKALCLSNTARKSNTVGEIVNLMAVDTQRLRDLTLYIDMIWSSPLQIILALYFLWDLLGVAVLAGKRHSVDL